jgi:preprotein translocase subunit SecD
MRALLALLALAQISAADFLEVRQVVEAGKGAKTYDAPRPPGQEKDTPEEKLTVSDELIVGDRHLAEVWPMKMEEDRFSVAVQLNAEGEQRMISATKDGKRGVLRLAVIIDGKVQTAPVVHSVPLGKNFQIDGTSWEETQALAKKMRAAMEAAKKPEAAKEEKK